MMKPASMTRNRGQVFSIGNYLMTGKVFGKGHFARVEEATHRVIGKKVAVKIIDLTLIKEEYARRNLHREPRVMARLRHPCIAALYETMMHGPRLYVVMEAAGGGDLCAHVLAARGASRGLPEARARALAAQLVSAVRHMHARGVVHRDLKMENIMLDSTKQFIKIVDFGLSNLWAFGSALRTPCGSLEYAAPELFVDGRRYGPEVDLWSIGVIVYGMVTGGLPFTAPDGGEGKSRPQLRAAIARGLTAKQKAATACVSAECRTFIQRLLEPNVEQRMKIEDASRHRWVRRVGMRMKTHPLSNVEPRVNREIYRQISELSSQSVMDVVAQIRADPFGNIGGIYNIKTHLHQMQAVPGTDLLWAATTIQEPRPVTPPEYVPQYEDKAATAPSTSKAPTPPLALPKTNISTQSSPYNNPVQKLTTNGMSKPNGISSTLAKPLPQKPIKTAGALPPKIQTIKSDLVKQSIVKKTSLLSPRSLSRPISSLLKKQVYKTQDNGDCCLDPRLPSIDEHSTSLNESNKDRSRMARACARKMEEPLRLSSCPPKAGEMKRTEFYRRAGDGLPSWAASGALPTPARLLLQNNATTTKRASLGNINSPHSSTNSHCKSERAMPVNWYSTRSPLTKEAHHLQRFRRTAPMK